MRHPYFAPEHPTDCRRRRWHQDEQTLWCDMVKYFVCDANPTSEVWLIKPQMCKSDLMCMYSFSTRRSVAQRVKSALSHEEISIGHNTLIIVTHDIACTVLVRGCVGMDLTDGMDLTEGTFISSPPVRVVPCVCDSLADDGQKLRGALLT